MKNTCDLCNKDRFRIENKVIPIVIPSEKQTIFLCLECGLSYFSQILKLNNSELDEYFDFILK